MLIPLAANDRWSLDFVSDQLTDGRRFRVLTVRIPLKPATDSETKPATCSDFIPASIPI